MMNTGKEGRCYKCGGPATKMQERARPAPADRRLACDNAECNKPKPGESWTSYPIEPKSGVQRRA
jgi:hypothetical protein